MQRDVLRSSHQWYVLTIEFGPVVPLALVQALACCSHSWLLACVSGTVNLQPVKSRRQFYKIATLAIVFCVAVVLGNVSLKFIPVSFNQAIGATTPAFTALLAAIMLGHRETKSVYLSLIPVIVGIVIASGAEPMFNLVGFCAALTATAGRALKSVLQGLMLSDSSEKMDSLSLLLYMAPVATAALVPITLFFEPTALANAIVLGQTGQGFWPLLVFNAVMAYFVNLTNFLVTKHTSALTLQVLGNAKGVVAVIASVLVFRNPVNVYTVFGYLVTVAGVVAYSSAKRQSKKNEALKKIAAKVSDVEQPRSPHGTSATAESRLLEKGDGTSNTNGHSHNRSLSSSYSDKLMPRGFSSLWEA